MASQKATGAESLPGIVGHLGRRDRAVRPASGWRGNDVVFLALPDDASADIAPALLARGVRVFDLSGAFRLRDDATARPLVSRGHVAARGHGLRHDRANRARCSRRAARRLRRLLPDGGGAGARAAGDAGLVAGDIIIDAKSGVSGAGKAPSERTHFCEVDESLSAYGVFAHRHAAEIEQELGCAVTFVPHLVPLDRGILETIYVRVPAGTTEAQIADVYERAYAGVAVRPAARRRTARHQARGAHELLRHRLEAGRGHGPADRRLVHRQPAEGRGRTGGAELQRRVRLRRADGAALMPRRAQARRRAARGRRLRKMAS